MVTVPALGPEWKADELHDMSKKAKREEKMENISTKWKAWNRGQTGLCGRHFTRRFTAWLVFGLCAAYVLCIYAYCNSDAANLGPGSASSWRLRSPECLLSARTK